jgi:HEAT repeat protein
VKKEIPAFTFTTQLSWVIDGKEFRRDITLEEQRHSFNVAMAKEPEQVRFDPDWVALHKLEFNPGDTKLKAQVVGAKDVHGRILAATALVKTAKRENLRAVANAYNKETFWGVRREMLAAFGACQTEDAIDILVEIIGKETDHMVLDFVFESAKNFCDEKILNATLQRYRQGGLPPRARAAAIKVMGAQREQAPLKTLLDAVILKEPRYGFTSANAMLALGASRLEEALDILIEQSVIGKNPYKSRRGAADGIGVLLPYLPKNIRRKAEERLVDLLRDPDDWMRRAAAGALFSAKVQWAENSLLSFRASLPFQDQMDFDGRLEGLRKGGESKLADLEKQIEDVNGRYRKLLERLEDIEGRLKKA